MKEGDKVICIGQSNSWTENYYTVGREYTVIRIEEEEDKDSIEYIDVFSDEGLTYTVPQKDFKLKIEELYNIY